MQVYEFFNLFRRNEINHTLVARFSSLAEAEKAIPAAGGYGGSVEREVIQVYSTAMEKFPELPELNSQLVEKALAKLTDDEKRAMGWELSYTGTRGNWVRKDASFQPPKHDSKIKLPLERHVDPHA